MYKSGISVTFIQQEFIWQFKCSEIWHCVGLWLVPSVSKAPYALKTLGNIHQMTVSYTKNPVSSETLLGKPEMSLWHFRFSQGLKFFLIDIGFYYHRKHNTVNTRRWAHSVKSDVFALMIKTDVEKKSFWWGLIMVLLNCMHYISNNKLFSTVLFWVITQPLLTA